MVGTKECVRSHAAVVFAAALALLLGRPLDSEATETKPATHSEWKYIWFANSVPFVRCADDDQTAAQSQISNGMTCPGTFDSWLGPWPNGTSINSAPIYDQMCTPPQVAGSNGNGYKIHGETRSFQYYSKTPITGGCQTSTTPSNSSVIGQFWWYCPGYPEWKIGIPNPQTEPLIPYCWLDTNATPPTKPPRDKCEEPATGCHSEGNPIELSLGIKYQRETDVEDSTASPLAFERSYNSFGAAPGAALGTLWRHTYDRSIDAQPFFALSAGKYSVHVNRPDGSIVTFDNLSGSAFVADADVTSKLVMLTSGGVLSGWQFTDNKDTQETYNANGRLISIHYRAGQTHTLSYNGAGQLQSVADPFGHQLGFAYNVNGTLHALTDPHGGTYVYAYDTAGRLSSVTAPESTTRQPALSGAVLRLGDRASLQLLQGLRPADRKIFAIGSDRVRRRVEYIQLRL